MRRREKTVVEAGKVAYEVLEGRRGGEGLFRTMGQNLFFALPSQSKSVRGEAYAVDGLCPESAR